MREAACETWPEKYRRACGQTAPPCSYPEMGTSMTDQAGRDDDDLLRRIEGGDERALTELFTRYRERLRRMVRLRLDRRLQGRIDSSDILQDAYFEVARRAPEYLAQPTMSPFLWLRFLTGQTLQ